MPTMQLLTIDFVWFLSLTKFLYHPWVIKGPELSSDRQIENKKKEADKIL